MATAAAAAKTKQFNFAWEGKDKTGKVFEVEVKADGTFVALE